MNATKTKKTAAATIADIAEDVIARRGDLGDQHVRTWAAAYTHWRDAVGELTSEELADAIDDAAERFWHEPDRPTDELLREIGFLRDGAAV